MPTRSTISKRLARVPWRRLWLSLFGLFILAAHWRWAVQHLYVLPPEADYSFALITVGFMAAAAAIVGFMVTGHVPDDPSHIVEKIEGEK